MFSAYGLDKKITQIALHPTLKARAVLVHPVKCDTPSFPSCDPNPPPPLQPLRLSPFALNYAFLPTQIIAEAPPSNLNHGSTPLSLSLSLPSSVVTAVPTRHELTPPSPVSPLYRGRGTRRAPLMRLRA